MATSDQHINQFGFLSAAAASQRNHLKENARLEKWYYMLEHWESYTSSHAKVVKRRIRKGIPNSIRGLVWYKLSGAEFFKAEHAESLYETLANSEEMCLSMKVIEADLNRTFPKNVMFRDDEGLSMLMRLLKAYSLYDPVVGYTQGMSYIAALLLMYLREEDSFWVFATLMKKYKMGLCFSDGMPKVYSSFYVSNGIVRHHLPKLFKHFNEWELSPTMYSTHWYMTGFAVNFPFETVLRIWDCFFSEGDKVFFRIHLAILKIQYKELMKSPFEKIMLILRDSGEIETKKLMKTAFKVRLSSKFTNRLLGDFHTNPKAKYLNWATSNPH